MGELAGQQRQVIPELETDTAELAGNLERDSPSALQDGGFGEVLGLRWERVTIHHPFHKRKGLTAPPHPLCTEQQEHEGDEEDMVGSRQRLPEGGNAFVREHDQDHTPRERHLQTELEGGSQLATEQAGAQGDDE